MDFPFFSIVLATYNREKTLARAIGSVVKQTYNNWELIIVDDGSKDESQKIINSFKRQFDNIQSHFQSNLGVVAAKNKGASLAEGKYITFLDSDDEYKPNHLQTRQKILCKDDKIDFLHGGVEVIGDEYVTDVYRPTQKIHIKDCAVGGTFFLKDTNFKKLRGFSGNAFESDADLMKRAKEAKMKIYKTNLATYIYHREGGSSISKDFLQDC